MEWWRGERERERESEEEREREKDKRKIKFLVCLGFVLSGAHQLITNYISSVSRDAFALDFILG